MHNFRTPVPRGHCDGVEIDTCAHELGAKRTEPDVDMRVSARTTPAPRRARTGVSRGAGGELQKTKWREN